MQRKAFYETIQRDMDLIYEVPLTVQDPYLSMICMVVTLYFVISLNYKEGFKNEDENDEMI